LDARHRPNNHNDLNLNTNNSEFNLHPNKWQDFNVNAD
jgi:hypothetical protein